MHRCSPDATLLVQSRRKHNNLVAQALIATLHFLNLPDQLSILARQTLNLLVMRLKQLLIRGHLLVQLLDLLRFFFIGAVLLLRT